MNSETLRHVIMNEEQLIADAFYGNSKALQLLESAYDAGYESKYLSEDWQKFLPRSRILHPINGIKNFIDDIVAKHHARKIRKINRKVKKEDDALIQAHKLGADRETIQNHLDRIKELGDDERQDRLVKYRNRKLNILNRKTGNDARDDYELEDKNGRPISIYQAINDKTLNPYARKGWSPDGYYDSLEKRNRLYNQKDDDNQSSGQDGDDSDIYGDDDSTSGNGSNGGSSSGAQPSPNNPSGTPNGEPKQNSSISSTGTASDSNDSKSGNFDIVKNVEDIGGGSVPNQDSPKPESNDYFRDKPDIDPNINPDKLANLFNIDYFGNGNKGKKVVLNKNGKQKMQENNSVRFKLSKIRHMLQETKYVK